MKKFSGITYYGGQNGSGHYQILINHTPKADVHIEGFLGMSGVFNNLTMSAETTYYGFDRDKSVIDHWRSNYVAGNVHFANCDYTAAKLVLAMSAGKTVFIHFDPPYRNTSAPKKYLWDIVTDADYEKFLEFVLSMLEEKSMPAVQRLYIMVSHWHDPLFDKYLSGTGKFKHIPFKTMGRRGPIPNGIYINYDPKEIELADYSYAGSNYTDRQRIKRKVERNYNKIMAMPPMEREILIQKIINGKTF